MIYKEKSYVNLPNLISLLRLILSPLLFIQFSLRTTNYWYIIPIFLITLLLTDFIDGFIAYNTGKITKTGKILDPIADKVFTFMIILSLYIFHNLPVIFLILFLGREFLIITGNIILKTAKNPKLIIQNIWEKLLTVFLVILYVIVAAEHIIPMSIQLSLVMILINLLFLYLSIVHFLVRFFIILFKQITPLKIILPIITIIGFISFLYLWTYNNYIDTPKETKFFNDKHVNILKTDKMDEEPSKDWLTKSQSEELLILGPALGRMTSESVLVFILTEKEETVDAIIYEDEERLYEVTRGTIETIEDDGFTGSVILEGLQPQTFYYYDIRQNGFSVIPDYLKDYCVFKTFPENNESFDEMRFMVTSGHKPLDTSVDDYYRSPIYPPQFRMWEALSRHIKQEHFDFLLLIGDQVYNDAPFEDTLPSTEEFDRILNDDGYRKLHEKKVRKAYRDNYIRFWNHPSMKKVMASTPSFMIWDDHEFKDGWGSNKQDSKNPVIKYMNEQQIKVYEEFQNVFNPKSYPDDDTKWHYNFNFGDIGFFIPDLRGYRDINKPIDEFPLMGEKQWTDYEEWINCKDILNKKAIFLGLSVPLVAVPNWVTNWLSNVKGDLRDDMRDRWFYKKNRPEMLKIIDSLFQYQEKSENFAYPMGGDIHVSLLSRIKNKDSQTDNPEDDYIYEFSSSGIANEDPATQTSYLIFKNIIGKNEISSQYYSQVLKIVSVLNYGVVEAKKLDDGDYDIRYYVGYEIPNTPDSILYRLMYSSNTSIGFPHQDIIHLVFDNDNN